MTRREESADRTRPEDQFASLWTALDELGPQPDKDRLRGDFDRLVLAWQDGFATGRDGQGHAAWPRIRSLAAVAALVACATAATVMTRVSMATRTKLRAVTSQVAVLRLRHEHWDQRLMAVAGLGAAAGRDAVMIDALLDRAIHDKNEHVRLAAIQELARISGGRRISDRLPELLAAARTPAVGVATIDLVVSTGAGGARPYLIDLADDPRADPIVRAAAAWALENVAPDTGSSASPADPPETARGRFDPPRSTDRTPGRNHV